MGCLAGVVDMLIEGRAVCCDTQALYCCCAYHDCFILVWIQTKSVCVQLIVYGLEAVINNSDSVISVERYYITECHRRRVLSMVNILELSADI